MRLLFHSGHSGSPQVARRTAAAGGRSRRHFSRRRHAAPCHVHAALEALGSGAPGTPGTGPGRRPPAPMPVCCAGLLRRGECKPALLRLRDPPPQAEGIDCEGCLMRTEAVADATACSPDHESESGHGLHPCEPPVTRVVTGSGEIGVRGCEMTLPRLLCMGSDVDLGVVQDLLLPVVGSSVQAHVSP